MDYAITLSFSARHDIQNIVRYISIDSPERAMEFGQFLIAKTKSLGQFPEIGRVVPEFGDSAIREIIVRSYRIIYRVNHRNCTVEIIRFWHGKRGIPTFH
jgi:toxin ParE1/3/4